MDTVIEYFFGTGDGTMSQWRSTADLDLDGDGVPESVALDFDGDGLIDDAMTDTDHDGVADLVALDLDDDGVPESRYTDSGRGLWDTASAPDTPAVPPTPREVALDSDDDGTPDTVLIDADGDGFADSYREIGSGSRTGSAEPSTR
ncbi:hypothetical protein [Gordonia neofelifaecis]|uniref:Pullulanase n=1 Tax=Gordonia neofelifaecis NRRL B-59395 TaxID=644548 RepID=F1YL72_9ACTN|nr:hypothetical protein [Gordonia neofelifaecis]EGD54532.1 hypothetical protein SCNU_13158 [Gordonia neofelifaecis NRRL B-59395]